MQQMRKFTGWYLKSFPGVKQLLPRLHLVSTHAELAEILATLPRDTPYPEAALRARRAKTGRTQEVALPHGYLDDRDTDQPPVEDPLDAGSGG